MENAQRKLDELRRAFSEAVDGDGSTFPNANRLAEAAGVDPAGLSKFLKARDGESGKISFVFVARLLYAIGGSVLLPGEVLPAASGGPAVSFGKVREAVGALLQLMQKVVAAAPGEMDGFRLARRLSQVADMLMEALSASEEAGKRDGEGV